MLFIGSFQEPCVADVTRFDSPHGTYWIEVNQNADGVTATLHGSRFSKSIVSNLPIPGLMSAIWLDSEVAQIAGTCGPGCSITFFASKDGVIGPFSDVMSSNIAAKAFAFSKQSKVFVASLSFPEKILAFFPIPKWCPGLLCRYRQTYSGNEYTFSAGGHSTTIPLPR